MLWKVWWCVFLLDFFGKRTGLNKRNFREFFVSIGSNEEIFDWSSPKVGTLSPIFFLGCFAFVFWITTPFFFLVPAFFKIDKIFVPWALGVSKKVILVDDGARGSSGKEDMEAKLEETSMDVFCFFFWGENLAHLRWSPYSRTAPLSLVGFYMLTH